MVLLDTPFYKDNDPDIESIFSNGVLCLSRNDFYGANAFFKLAAPSGHISAIYNLAILNANGSISPYDIDFAADCLYKAAAGGHPKAKTNLPWLEAADQAILGIDNLTVFISDLSMEPWLNYLLMIVSCRFYSALCKKYDIENEVIEYELDAASYSDNQFAQAFIRRTGISADNYKGGSNRLKAGSIADQITDGLNYLTIQLMRSGYSDERCLITRCTIVGYLISKSIYSDRSKPLLGSDAFFLDEIYILFTFHQTIPQFR